MASDELMVEKRRLQEVGNEIQKKEEELVSLGQMLANPNKDSSTREWRAQYSEFVRGWDALVADKKALAADKEILATQFKQAMEREAVDEPQHANRVTVGTSGAQGVEHATRPVADFYKALKTVTIDGDFMRLPSNTYFLGDPMKGSCMFIRKPYIKMASIVDTLVKKSGINKIIIIGSPGIGKTIFGIYLMWHLVGQADAPPAIMYDRGSQDSKLCFLPGGDVLEANSLSSFKAYTCDPSTWLIVDGCKPPRALAANTILITSPDREIWWPFHKECGTTVRYMAPWSEDEIMACWETMHKDSIDIAKLRSLLKLWGDRPRYILEKANDDSAQEYLEAALAESDFLALVHNLGRSGQPKAVSDRLLSMQVVDEACTRIQYSFASEYIREQVIAKLLMKSKYEIRLWCSTATEPIAGGLRGSIFEQLGHEVLASGGVFDMRELKTTRELKSSGESALAVSPLKLKPSPIHVFQQLEEVNLVEDGVYCKPRNKNLAPVDAIIQPNILLQFTVADVHEIGEAGLLQALAVLKDHANAQFIFVIPPDKFDTFKKQRVKRLTKSGSKPGSCTTSDDEADPTRVNIKQYALKLDLLPTHEGSASRGNNMGSNNDAYNTSSGGSHGDTNPDTPSTIRALPRAGGTTNNLTRLARSTSNICLRGGALTANPLLRIPRRQSASVRACVPPFDVMRAPAGGVHRFQ